MSPPEGEPELIPIGVLVEHKQLGYILLTDEYNESSNAYHCRARDGIAYLGCFERKELRIIKDEDIKE
ncbi:MAG: hypothetical protein LBQ74_14150 [Prevotella sp.]|jgi:hypothetical protein|nr:hypothetical protein [Prevotella sp.]